MAKGLGGGFPIGAMWVGERAADLFHRRLARLDLRRHAAGLRRGARRARRHRGRGLLAHVTRESAPWIRDLKALARDFPRHVSEIRGLGFLVGVQMASDSAPYVDALRERGLLTAPAGVNVIRLLPPLITPASDLARSVALFRETLEAF